MTASAALVRFALGLRLEDVPADVARAAKLHILDGIGVGLAASTVPLSAGWAAGAAEMGGHGPATAFGRTGGLSAPAAAMANGALMHSLEYDDTHIASVVHGGAVAVPAALAAAEAAGAGGADLIAGYLAAWEAMVRIGLSAPGAFQAHGFQVSSIGGAIGAALAAAAIRRMDEETAIHALGVAGSQASGLMAFLNNGSTAKALNPGWAAHTGLAAAALAEGGMTGPDDVLEGRFGVFDSFARDAQAAARLEGHLADLGRRWHMPDAAFKLYPCCHYIHPFLEALQGALDGGVSAADVAGITCHVPDPEAPLICEPWERRQHPASGYDGKWGLAYCLAALLVTRRVDVATFAADPDPKIVEVARRMDWRPMEGHVFPTRFQARIDIRLPGGEVRTREVENALGAPGRPIGEATVLEKFRTNAARALAAEGVTALENAVLGLDALASVAPLTAALSSSGSAGMSRWTGR